MIYPINGLTTYRPEHRPWRQTTLSHGSKPWSYFHRLRYEGRFRRTIIDDYLQNEFNFNFRLRYLFQARYFLNQEPDANYKWLLMASDEVLVNIGKEIKDGIRLDQNRISIGAGVQFKNTTIQLAYMNQLIESNTTFNFRMNHNLQLLVFQNFDWYNFLFLLFVRSPPKGGSGCTLQSLARPPQRISTAIPNAVSVSK